MSTRLGLDLVSIDRIRRAYERWGTHFLERIYSPEEIHYCLQKHDPFPSLAARFAAKEAVAKALGCGLGQEIAFRDIEITHKKNCPQVKINSKIQQRLKKIEKFSIDISLTHEKNQAAAIALIS